MSTGHSTCDICSNQKLLVSSNPISVLLRKINKGEQDRRRVKTKYSKKYEKVRKKEEDKYTVDHLRHRNNEILRPLFRRLTQSNIEDRSTKVKIAKEKLEHERLCDLQKRKNEKMKKTIANYGSNKNRYPSLDSDLIITRLNQTIENLILRFEEFEIPNHDISASIFAAPISEQHIREEKECIEFYKLVRLQQLITSLNAVTGPKAAPLPAQIPPNRTFKLTPSMLTAGVLLNIRQPEAVQFQDKKNDRNRHVGYSGFLSPAQIGKRFSSTPIELLTSLLSYPHSQLQDIIKSVNFDNNNVAWVEQDEVNEETWEKLDLSEAGALVQNQSSYLSSLWTWGQKW